MSLWSNYKVLIVMTTSIVGIHYFWYQMQYNKDLVPAEERKIKFYGLDLDKEHYKKD